MPETSRCYVSPVTPLEDLLAAHLFARDFADQTSPEACAAFDAYLERMRETIPVIETVVCATAIPRIQVGGYCLRLDPTNSIVLYESMVTTERLMRMRFFEPMPSPKPVVAPLRPLPESFDFDDRLDCLDGDLLAERTLADSAAAFNPIGSDIHLFDDEWTVPVLSFPREQ